METRRILGTSRLSTKNKLTLVENVKDILKTKEGDLIVFYMENDKVCIDKSEINDKDFGVNEKGE